MNKIIKTITVLGGVAAAVCSCGPKGAEKGTEAVAVQAVVPAVSVYEAALENVPQDAVYSATVQANAVNNIAPQTAGRIQKLNVEVGDFVSAGQILAEMDRIQLDQAELKLRNAEDELKRVKSLFEEGGISQSDYEQLELSYKVSKSSYDNLLENTVLRSPISGVVTARYYDRGDLFGMSQPLYTIQQITPVKILVGISESDYTKVKRGDAVVVNADALPGKEFNGTVVRLYPVMDAASHTFNVEVQVRNERRELRPGMFARVKVNFGSNNSIVVPDSAVLKQQGSGQRTVYVVNAENVAELKLVTIGRHFDGKYEIVSGLEEGDKVVVKGQTTLKSGVTVEII